MADGKWIAELTPGMPLFEAAQRVIQIRLQVVHDFLPRAVREASRDPEFVHQLRVGTRRADAAFRIFRSCFTGRHYRKARERLRTVRRAAGEARDWDVFLLDLATREANASAVHRPGLDLLMGHAIGRRIEAQTALDALESGTGETFDQFVQQVLLALSPPEDGTAPIFIDLARPMILSRIEKLREATSGNLETYEQLHQVRIAGKRLRYAIEVVADCFPTSLRTELYPRIEEMQDILGRVNDSHVAITRLQILREKLRGWPQIARRCKSGIDSLLKFHQRRLPTERRRFLRWLSQWESIRPEAYLI